MKVIYFCSVILITAVAIALSSTNSLLAASNGMVKADSTINEITRTKVKYSKDGLSIRSLELVNHNFDFSLTSTSVGKFNLSFYNNTKSDWIEIKVYDLIGNIVVEDIVWTEGFFTKSYDLSFLTGKFFVVAVGNAKYNRTKKILTHI